MKLRALSPSAQVFAVMSVVCALTLGVLAITNGLHVPAKHVIRFKNASPQTIAANVALSCAQDADKQPCLERTVLSLVDPYGPALAMQTLTELLAEKVMFGKGDYHDFVHRIGRLTAKKEGLNPDAFFLCPTDYNYGCQHGFFEQALVVEPDAKKAAGMVCDKERMKDRPLKFMFYCYHGVGHGIMMAKAYDLDASLVLCDEMDGSEAQTGCYQGVFMENVVGYMNKTSRKHSFSEADKLVPCNSVAEKYRWQCYLNHGGYLAGTAGSGTGAVERASYPCLKADPANIHGCFTSVGLMSTNPGWQGALAPVFTDDFYKNAVSICERFPADYILDCMLSGVDNLANFDAADTTRLIRLCGAMPARYKDACFERIGVTVKNEVPAGTPPATICKDVPAEYVDLCIKGASS